MKKIIYLLTAVVILSAAPAFAYCPFCDLNKGSKASGDWVNEKVEKMTDEFGLTDEQASGIKAIMMEKKEKKMAVKTEANEKIKAIREEYSAKVKGLLNEEQQAKFDAMHAEMKEKGSMKGSMKKGSMKGSDMEQKGSDMEHKGSGMEEKDSKKGS